MPRKGYVWVKALTPARKAEITAACERLIAEMKARFLPVTRPHQFNYPVDIRGRWRGEGYSFLVRFRSDEPDAIEPEYDAPFAKLEHVDDRFAVLWMRHTGRWCRRPARPRRRHDLRARPRLLPQGRRPHHPPRRAAALVALVLEAAEEKPDPPPPARAGGCRGRCQPRSSRAREALKVATRRRRLLRLLIEERRYDRAWTIAAQNPVGDGALEALAAFVAELRPATPAAVASSPCLTRRPARPSLLGVGADGRSDAVEVMECLPIPDR